MLKSCARYKQQERYKAKFEDAKQRYDFETH
jgi:hypothetical protein